MSSKKPRKIVYSGNGKSKTYAMNNNGYCNKSGLKWVAKNGGTTSAPKKDRMKFNK